MNFVNTGLDSMTVNSFVVNRTDEEREVLQKGMNKNGLVQVETTVNGKTGTYSRMQWKKASDVDPKTDKVIGGQNTGDTKTATDAPKGEIKFNAPADGNTKAAMAQLLVNGHSRDDIMAAAKAQGITWEEKDHPAINWMRCSMAIQNHMKNSKTAPDVDDNPGGTEQGQPVPEKGKPKPKKEQPKPVEPESVPDQGDEQDDGVFTPGSDDEKEKKESEKSKAIPHKVTGKNMSDLVANLKEHGLEMDSADQHSPQDEVMMYRDGKTYTATFNKYSDGGVEVINFKEQKDDSDSDDVEEPKKEDEVVEKGKKIFALTIKNYVKGFMSTVNKDHATECKELFDKYSKAAADDYDKAKKDIKKEVKELTAEKEKITESSFDTNLSRAQLHKTLLEESRVADKLRAAKLVQDAFSWADDNKADDDYSFDDDEVAEKKEPKKDDADISGFLQSNKIFGAKTAKDVDKKLKEMKQEKSDITIKMRGMTPGSKSFADATAKKMSIDKEMTRIEKVMKEAPVPSDTTKAEEKPKSEESSKKSEDEIDLSKVDPSKFTDHVEDASSYREHMAEYQSQVQEEAHKELQSSMKKFLKGKNMEDFRTRGAKTVFEDYITALAPTKSYKAVETEKSKLSKDIAATKDALSRAKKRLKDAYKDSQRNIAQIQIKNYQEDLELYSKIQECFTIAETTAKKGSSYKSMQNIARRNAS